MITKPRTIRDLLESDEEITLLLQGGGMRGVYSIAFLDELHHAGYGSRFQHVVGTSAGALNGSYFLSGQTGEGVLVYTDLLSGKRFINFSRINKILDIDYLVDEVLFGAAHLNQERFFAHKSPLWVPLAKSRGGIDWIKCDDSLPLSEVLRAASAMPIFYGKEVAIGKERYLDGGVVETVGISKALSLGSDNILAILTRPLMSQQRSYGEDRVARFLAKKKGHSPFIQESVAAIDNSFAKVQSLALDPKSSLFAIAPSVSLVSRLTRSKKKLQAAVALARRDISNILNS